jgi:hypothetical protein
LNDGSGGPTGRTEVPPTPGLRSNTCKGRFRSSSKRLRLLRWRSVNALRFVLTVSSLALENWMDGPRLRGGAQALYDAPNAVAIKPTVAIHL